MTHTLRSRSRANLAILVVAAAALFAATGSALAKVEHRLPAGSGKLTTCHKKLFKVGGVLPVSTAFAVQKGKHPAKALLTCTSADKVAVAGKKYYSKSPFGVGKKIKVAGVTDTMGVATSLDGKPTSGPIYGWAGGGIVIDLMNPTGG
jgi:hypothetical protein